jgi:hypothetical protein
VTLRGIGCLFELLVCVALVLILASCLGIGLLLS